MVDNTFGTDDRETPAVRINDGVDYVVMPQWKLFLVQLLNIAGLGPIFGALQGSIMGPVVFLWITFGTILPAVSMIIFQECCRNVMTAASISEVCGIYLRRTDEECDEGIPVLFFWLWSASVFAVGPAGLIVNLFQNNGAAGLL